MIKEIFKRVGLILAAILALYSFGVYAAESGEPDYKVGLEITFDRAEYFVGETATADIFLKGFNEEANKGYLISGFQTYVIFDKNLLSTNDVDMGFSEDITSLINNEERSFALVPNKDAIAVYFAFPGKSGISVSDKLDASGNLKIGSIKFKVNGSNNEGKIPVSFSDKKSMTEVILPPGTFEDNKNDTARLTIDALEGASARLASPSITPNKAEYKGNAVEASVSVRTNQSCILIAQLYEETQVNKKLTRGIVTKQITFNEGIYDYSFNDICFDNIGNKANLKVSCYLWSLSGMKPICDSVPANIN